MLRCGRSSLESFVLWCCCYCFSVIAGAYLLHFCCHKKYCSFHDTNEWNLANCNNWWAFLKKRKEIMKEKREKRHCCEKLEWKKERNPASTKAKTTKKDSRNPLSRWNMIQCVFFHIAMFILYICINLHV